MGIREKGGKGGGESMLTVFFTNAVRIRKEAPWPYSF